MGYAIDGIALQLEAENLTQTLSDIINSSQFTTLVQNNPNPDIYQLPEENATYAYFGVIDRQPMAQITCTIIFYWR